MDAVTHASGSMNIKHLFKNISLLNETALPDMEISGIAIDSRCVVEGNLFISIAGYQTDGHRYIQHALDRGAVAVIAEKPVELHADVPVYISASTKEAYSLLSQQWTHQVWKKLKHIAVTGTTGKTSVSWMIACLLNALGEKCGLIGTAGYYAGNEALNVRLKGPLTTPTPGELHPLYQSMVAKGCQTACMEASSFGIAQKRIYGMQMDTAVLTNLSFNHHVAFHGEWMDYVLAKKELFSMIKERGSAIINADDPYAEKFIIPGQQHFLYGKAQHADVKITTIHECNDHMEIELDYKGNQWNIHTPYAGAFQAYNFASAFCVGLSLGYEPLQMVEKLAHIKAVPGRWEILLNAQPFTVAIDKANTPIAFKSIQSMIKTRSYAKKIAVFGNFGGGDPVERALLAKLIEETYDALILTLDDPGDEDIEKNFDIFTSFFSDTYKSNIQRVVSRKKALERALEIAKKDDLIVVLGRGNQKEFVVKNKKIPFNDVEIMKSLLKKRGWLNHEA